VILGGKTEGCQWWYMACLTIVCANDMCRIEAAWGKRKQDSLIDAARHYLSFTNRQMSHERNSEMACQLVPGCWVVKALSLRRLRRAL